jgi:hypothetical protein
MYTEDYPKFMPFHSEPPFHPQPISEPAPTTNERGFPSELLDSGFEWTEILTTEPKR